MAVVHLFAVLLIATSTSFTCSPSTYQRSGGGVPCDQADDTTTFGPETLNGDTGVTLGSGEGFNTLAGYLFGNNTQEVAMGMTTPVNIDVDASGRCGVSSASAVL